MKTPTFSKKQYEALAKLCRELKVSDPAAKAVLVEELAFLIGQDNPNFKPELFLAASAPNSGA